MHRKRFYLTKMENLNSWWYIGDPLHPFTTLDHGLLDGIDPEEVRMDKDGFLFVDRLVVMSEASLRSPQASSGVK